MEQGKHSVGKGRPSWWNKASHATSFEEIRKIIPESEMNDDTISEDAFDALTAAAWDLADTGWGQGESDIDFDDDSTWFDATTPKELWNAAVQEAEDFKEGLEEQGFYSDDDDDGDWAEDDDDTDVPSEKFMRTVEFFKQNVIADYEYRKSLKDEDQVIAVYDKKSGNFKGYISDVVDMNLPIGKVTLTKNIKQAEPYASYDIACEAAASEFYDEDLKNPSITIKIVPMRKIFESKKPNDLVEKFIESNFPRSNFEEEVQRRKNAVNDAICELAEMIDCNEVVKFTQDVLNLYCR